jgi:uncharacterized coiled-coil protein SlyX
VIDGELRVGGFIYAADFPKVAAAIKANKDLLGFSYEARELYCDDPDANPVRITDCVFTGATILLKQKAAYRHTRLAANAAGELKMDKEVQDALDAAVKKVTDLITPLATSITTLSAAVEEMKTKPAAVQAKAEAHAKKFDDLAASMVADGMDASTLVRQAAYIRSEGAAGRLVTTFPANLAAAGGGPVDQSAAITAVVTAALKPFEDKIAAQGTTIKDLSAAIAKGATQPERKTLPANITALLAKSGIKIEDGQTEKLPIDKVNEALAGLPALQRITAKDGLAKAGLID